MAHVIVRLDTRVVSVLIAHAMTTATTWATALTENVSAKLDFLARHAIFVSAQDCALATALAST
jgi:hypothetical protein